MSGGSLTFVDLATFLRTGEIDTVVCAFPDLYGRLAGKHVTARHFLQTVADHGMHVCDYTLACDVDMTPVAGYALTSWDTGYGDLLARPDLGTLRRAAWREGTAIVLCDVTRDGEPVAVAPRTVLREQVRRAQALGLSVRAASELEFFLFDHVPPDGGRPTPAGRHVADYQLLETGAAEPYLRALRRALEASGIPVECSKGEWGVGQHEVNLAYADVVGMADRHVVYKHAAKELAADHGLGITYMAKWDTEAAGNSMHAHLSLWRGARPAAAAVLRSFVAGVLAHLREITLFLAPYPNSYKRFVAGSFAPTAIAWAEDNRTAALRMVGEGRSRRVECRVPGGDANPYLAYAALLAAGLDGIERGLVPPDPATGDLYAATDVDRIPETLDEAIGCAEESELLVAALGKEVLEHVLHFARTEERASRRAVTDWERQRLFDRS